MFVVSKSGTTLVGHSQKLCVREYSNAGDFFFRTLSREGFITRRREVCECLGHAQCKLKTEVRICFFLYPILLLMY